MNILFGNLTWSSLPHEWFTIAGTATIIGGGAFMAGILTYFKRWKWLWNGWLTSTDPKKIGIMYLIVASLMLFRGAVDAAMIWLQQSIAEGPHAGYLTPAHFQQIFTAHGDIMVFFATMGLLFGLINLIVPLQIGARDLAFPFMNSLGFWLYVAGAIMINMFFIFGGEFASAGWLSLPPLAEIAYSPGVGVDYWIWSLQISGLGTLIGGINFIVTILKMRAPGMKLMDMPMFTWTSLCSMLLVVSVFPILTVVITLLWLDRYFGLHFFTATAGGNPMMYVNLIWMWGHPEVYILILPTFGIYSEIVSTFAQKKLFGYTSQVLAAFGVTALACLVWLHHFFTMGAGADVNAFFGIMTGIIAIPTAVQFFNWISTLYKGKIRFATPLYWFMGFLACFTFGGMAGVLLSLPAADYQLHNSLFLVAHFHTMIVSGALFGIFAGITYWFPKIFGFRLNESLGRKAFWFWLFGFLLSFGPLYLLGFLGATRRLDHYNVPGWQPLFIAAGLGLALIGIGALFQVAQIIVSIRDREKNRDTSGDPWNGRTLEWSTASPPPFYNFAVVPTVTGRDAWWENKQKMRDARTGRGQEYQNIEMPKNTAMAIYLSAFAFLASFAFVWHIVWMQIFGLAGVIVCIIIRSLDENTEYTVTAQELEKFEKSPARYL